MNISKIASGVLLLAVVPFLMACPKRKNTVPPEPDTETQSSVDVTFANFVISDIDMICSFGCEADQTPDFYMQRPGEANIVSAVVQAPMNTDPLKDQLVVNFNNVNCLDGKFRNGAVYLQYPNNVDNAHYYHNYRFGGDLILVDYRVDGWQIKTVNGIPAKIYSNRNSASFNPATTNLSWTIEGNFEFTHPTDPSKNMVWNGKLIKTLTNTSDSRVFNPNRLVAIDWSLAKVEYSGAASGVTSGDVPFKMSIHEATPVTRDFTCYSDVVGGVTSTQPFTSWKKEFHPFKSGIVSFTTGTRYPRQIYYGNEGNRDLQLQCDNSGEVLIKGNSYRVNF